MTIITIIRPHLTADKQLFSDLPAFQAPQWGPHGGTIPPHVIVINLHPDLIIIINEVKREVVVIELTCPWDSNIERCHNHQEEKYAPLIADSSRDFRTFHFSFKVSARGQITK